MSAVNDDGWSAGKTIDKLIINGTECTLNYASAITNKPDFTDLSIRVTALENAASTGGSGGSGGSDDYATYAELQALSSNVDKLDDDIFNISQRLSNAEYTLEDLSESRPIAGVNDAGLYLKVAHDGKWTFGTELPSVTSTDQGKVLTVDSTGKWAPENAVTYESKLPYPNGKELSLVTTGEKYSWGVHFGDLDRASSWHDSQISANSNRISAVEQHIESLDTESENLASRMNSAETDLSEIHSAIDAIEENISALSGVPADITAILDAITIINQRLTALENGESGSITHASVNDKKLTMTDGNVSVDGTKVTVSAANMAVFGSKLTIQ